MSTAPEHEPLTRPTLIGADPGVVTTEHEPEALRVLTWPRAGATSIVLTIVVAAALAIPAIFAAEGAVIAAIALVPTLAVAYLCRLAYEGLAPRRRGLTVRRLVAAVVAAAGGVLLTWLVLLILAQSAPASAWAPAGVLCALSLLAAGWLRDLEQRLGTANRRIVFVGSGPQHVDLRREIARRGDLHLAGHLATERLRTTAPPQLDAQLDAMRPTTLVLASHAVQDPKIVAAAARLHGGGVRVRSLPDFYEQEFRKVASSELSPAWFLFDVAAIHDHRFYGRAKRALETAAAGSVLLATAPLLPVIALAIRLSSAGPILFRQDRVGRGGEPVQLIKFRTMRPAPPTGAWATDDEHRITRVGRFLRRYRLDELPQLYNVVRGDLALVGPRPEQPGIVAQLSERLEYYEARHCVRPGLTGWAQVNYGYGGTMADVVEKLQYEFFYIKHQSLLLDLRVLMATARTILSGSGR